MKNNSNLLAVLAGAIVVIGCFFFFGGTKTDSSQNLSVNSQFSYDTTSKGFTNSTTTINTTSTNLWASVNKVNYMFYNGTSTITCSADAVSTTAASSSLASGRGIMWGNVTTGIAKVGFGQCFPGNEQCYLHMGALNCLANIQTVVSVVKQ